MKIASSTFRYNLRMRRIIALHRLMSYFRMLGQEHYVSIQFRDSINSRRKLLWKSADALANRARVKEKVQGKSIIHHEDHNATFFTARCKALIKMDGRGFFSFKGLPDRLVAPSLPGTISGYWVKLSEV